jgi:hypothetical protein
VTTATATPKAPKAPKAKKTPVRKTKSVVVEGVVERADLVMSDPFHVSFYSAGEKKEFSIDLALRLADGSAAYFHCVRATRTRVMYTDGSSFASFSMVFHVEGESAKWMKVEKSTDGDSMNDKIVPLVKVGDTIRVMGRLKAHRISKYGKRYVTLTHVWKDPPEGAVSDPLPPATDMRE